MAYVTWSSKWTTGDGKNKDRDEYWWLYFDAKATQKTILTWNNPYEQVYTKYVAGSFESPLQFKPYDTKWQLYFYFRMSSASAQCLSPHTAEAREGWNITAGALEQPKTTFGIARSWDPLSGYSYTLQRSCVNKQPSDRRIRLQSHRHFSSVHMSYLIQCFHFSLGGNDLHMNWIC